MASLDNDYQFCWERVNDSCKLFRISQLFAPAKFASRLLALHALFASVDEAGSSSSDEQVTKRKLDWWHRELQPRNISVSRHPVISLLRKTGVADRLQADAVDQLFSGAYRRLDEKAPANTQEFHSLCHAIYQPRVLMEYSVCGGSEDLTSDFQAVFYTGGLTELLRESCGRTAQAFWWLPLHLLAQHGVRRQELRDNSDSAGSRAIFCEIIEDSNRLNAKVAWPDGVCNNIQPGELHILLLAVLKSRQIQRLGKRKPSSFAAEFNQRHFSDVFAAWSTTRKLKY